MSDLEAKLAEGEHAFAQGHLGAACQLLSECAEDPRATSAQRAQAHNDLAVIAVTEQRPADAIGLLLRSLADNPCDPAALENIAECCVEQADLVQASHWLARAVESASGPDAERLQARLRELLKERRRTSAPSAPVRAGGVDGSSAAGGERVLIVVDWFFPAVGGTERLAEAVGVALQAQGLTVEVAARRLEERAGTEHRGMLIHELEGDYRAQLSSLVRERPYDAVLAISGTLCWPVLATLQLPRPRPRIAVVPCINAGNYDELHANPEVLPVLAQLAGEADVLGYSSRSGYDIRFWEELGLPGAYLPNAVDHVQRAAVAPTSGMAGAAPLLLHVGNMWPEKDQLGMLRRLREDPGDWQLALIGAPSPDRPEIALEVARLAAQDARVHLLGPTSAGEVAAAMDDASILLLPSLAEATPLVLLEAMSRRLPWIATPTCGAAHDHAGGLILPLDLFPEGIDFLTSNPHAARRLGEAGESHWRHAYNWDVIGPRYARVLRGQELSDLQAPARAIAETDAIRADFYDGRPVHAREQPHALAHAR